MGAGKATVGLFALRCACGKDVKVLDVIHRTLTGRETVRHYCHACGCVSWWWRTFTPGEKVMLVDREQRPEDARHWPPFGWTQRHMAPRRVR